MNYVYFGRWFKKTALTPLKYLGIVLLATVAFLSFAQNLPIPGNFKSLVVMSGSMEPKIHTGSVAIVKPSEDIQTGDIITFKDPRDPKNLITHRIVEINGLSESKEISEINVFKTKGDANNTPDNWEVTKDNIVGKFLFSVPFLGYAINFAKQPQGFLLLILFPALLIIINEIGSIKHEIVGAKNTKNEKREKGTKAAVAASAVLLTFAFSSGHTLALLSDTETSSGNTISVGVWDVAESSVVLNEFLPNPSGDDNAPRPGGEWVELYNKSSEEDFDLAGWHLYDSDDNHELEITSVNSASYDDAGNLVDDTATTIPVGGFLVVYRDGDGDFALNNTGGDKVRLYNGAMGGSGVYEVDSHEYTMSAPEDKSFARIPDGADNWVDPIPTPGGPNELEPGPETEAEPEPEPEPETENVTATHASPDNPVPEDPPESSKSAQPAITPPPSVPESSESAQPKESDD